MQFPGDGYSLPAVDTDEAAGRPAKRVANQICLLSRKKYYPHPNFYNFSFYLCSRDVAPFPPRHGPVIRLAYNYPIINP